MSSYKKETQIERLDRRDKDIEKLFSELHQQGMVWKGKKVRMRYDDAVKEIAWKFYLSAFTVEQILKGNYRK